MLHRFPLLLRTSKKLAEIAGAGCASAVVAFLLGNWHEPAATAANSANAPAVVRLAPADEDMIRAVRQESATLVAHLRAGPPGTSATAAAPVVAATTSPAGAASASTGPKAAKPMSMQPRKEPKTVRAGTPETKPRAIEPAPVAAAAAPPALSPSRPANTPVIEPTEERVAQVSTTQPPQPFGIKPLSTWFSDVPRPPVGIREESSRSM
jgi:hypothetical protein